MKKLASLLLALSLIFGLVSFSYAEEPYEVVIETVTFGAEYADIPAIEEAINAITVPAINVSVKILNVGIPEHAQKISMMIAGGEKIDLVMAGLTMPMVNMAVDGMLLPLDELLASQGADIQALLGRQQASWGPARSMARFMPSLRMPILHSPADLSTINRWRMSWVSPCRIP